MTELQVFHNGGVVARIYPVSSEKRRKKLSTKTLPASAIQSSIDVSPYRQRRASGGFESPLLDQLAERGVVGSHRPPEQVKKDLEAALAEEQGCDDNLPF